MSQSSERLYFNEVVTRDGFQIEPGFIATDAKVALIDALSNCGYAKIEVTSFTSPKAIPMLRDAEEVMGRIRHSSNTDPRKLQNRKVLCHRLVRRKWQLRKADPECTDPAKSAPLKSQSVKTTRSVCNSARSASVKS